MSAHPIIDINAAYHTQLEAAGHKLIRMESGHIDVWRLDAGFHNGPECELCGETWCHHCKPAIKPCPGRPTQE